MTDADEGAYILLGRLALRGDLGLFQDEMTGQRMPLPYYFIGFSQILFGPSLVAARLFSAGLGLVCIVLVFLLARRLGGELCGVLAALFAATQSVIIGYFASAYYHSLVSFLLLAGLYVLLGTDLRHRRVIAMVVFSLLFFTRPNIATVIPLVAVYLLGQARGVGERVAIALATLAPPLAFFLSDVNHLKLLAYVPVAGQLVAPLGFRTASAPLDTPVARSLGYALTLFVRWYKTWILSALVLLVALGLRARQRRLVVKAHGSNGGVGLIAVVTVYLAAWQFAIFPTSPRLAVGYFQSFIVLGAVGLGFGFSRLIEDRGLPRAGRAALGGAVAILLLVSPALSRPPTLPLAVSLRDSPVLTLDRFAETLRALAPRGSKVFLFAPSQAVYLAGLQPYLRQVTHLYTLTTIADERARRKSGLWGESEIREWLTGDADYAVVVPAYLRAFRDEQRTPSGNNVDLIESLLDRYFTRSATFDDRRGIVYEVYKRKVR